MVVINNQSQAPLVEALRAYARMPLLPFHMPGHKNGRIWQGTHESLRELAKWDLTEMTGWTWEQSVAQAEHLAAAFFHADKTFFLTQGATQGIQAALLGGFAPGDKVLVDRACHISVIHALILADLWPVYIPSDVLTEWGTPAGMEIRKFDTLLNENPEVKGLIITNPTYQGIAVKLEPFRRRLGQRRMVVDEAHGGHLSWCGHPGFDAADSADLWVQGTHKLFGALTQTGMLHLRGGKTEAERIASRMQLVASTSPSYILLASLDFCRQFLAIDGNAQFRDRTADMCKFKQDLRRIPGVRVLDDDVVAETEKIVDPWKITVSLADLGLSGYQCEERLRLEFLIQAEYADAAQVTLFAAPWQPREDLSHLKRAITELARKVERRLPTDRPLLKESTIPPLIISPRQAALSSHDEVSLRNAVGRIAAGVVAPYPPGIPLIAPGEEIRPEEAAAIEMIIKKGGNVRGISPEGNVPVLHE